MVVSCGRRWQLLLAACLMAGGLVVHAQTSEELLRSRSSDREDLNAMLQERQLEAGERHHRLRMARREQPRANRRVVFRPSAAAPNPLTEDRSLSVDDNIEMGPNSNLFKDGKLLLWTDTVTYTTALGEDALASVGEYYSKWDTAIGHQALANLTGGSAYYPTRNTAVGARALYASTTGIKNVAVGDRALVSNETGRYNTAVGSGALSANTSGLRNVAIGEGALGTDEFHSYNIAVGPGALQHGTVGFGNVAIGGIALTNGSGSYNVVIGDGAGTTPVDSSNILINNYGVYNESNTLRIGQGTGTGIQQLSRAFIAGIYGAAPAGFSEPVCVSNSDQLGPCGESSEKLKTEIEDLGDYGEKILGLRPVQFRYRQEPGSTGSNRIAFGLVAEEVAKTFPELVARDKDGQPERVRYHLLPPLLVHRVNVQQDEITLLRRQMDDRDLAIADLRRKLEELENELAASRR